MATKKKMLQAAAGNAAGAGTSGGEEIFSIDVWTGNGVNSSDTLQVTNDVDFTQGGMVWIKARDQAYGHSLHDTERGFGNYISTADTGGENYAGDLGWSAGSFNSDGFSSPRGTNQSINELGSRFVSYSFRNAPRFFEAIEYTGDGTGGNRGISHNLGVEPSAIWIKNLDNSQDWECAFRTSGDNWQYDLALNATGGGNGPYNYKSNNYPISSTQFFTETGSGTEGQNNTSGVRYIAYIFAGNSDGGYGPNSNDDVISIGSYSGNGSSQKINIGFQPEFLLVKRLAPDSWPVVDHMRRFSQDESPLVRTNSNSTESAPSAHVRPYTDGFEVYTGDGEWNYSGSNYVYMAIRSKKSTMPPVSADEVFHASYGDASYGLSYPESILTTSMRVDMFINTSGANNYITDRMRSSINLHYMNVGDGAAETDGSEWRLDLGSTGAGYTTSRAEPNRPFQAWKRAPHFFAMSAWTGNGSSQYIPHDLGIKPDLILVKKRDTLRSWIAYSSPMGATKYIEPNNSNAAGVVSTVWGNTEPTSTEFYVQGNESVNNSGAKYIGYSFGSVAGVSKISSYIGNGSSQTIDCGFSAGVQFLLIKRLDSSGEWYTWDKTRGIVSGSEAHNGFGVSEFTSDSIDPTSVGFVVEELSGSTSINASGGEYLFYAIAN